MSAYGCSVPSPLPRHRGPPSAVHPDDDEREAQRAPPSTQRPRGDEKEAQGDASLMRVAGEARLVLGSKEGLLWQCEVHNLVVALWGAAQQFPVPALAFHSALVSRAAPV